MSKRTARLELVEAAIDWHEETDAEGRVWSDKPSPSYRPHFLRLVAANGEILGHSENYCDRANARRASRAWVQAFRDILATPTTERVSEVSK